MLGLPPGKQRADLLGWPIDALSKRVQPPILGNDDSLGSAGATVAPNASAGVLAAWTTLVEPVPFTCDGFYLSMLTTTGQPISYLFDIGIGGSGDNIHQILVEAMPYNGSANADVINRVYIPLSVPAGVRLAARCQSSAASAANTVTVRPNFVRGGLASRLRCSYAETIGFNRGGGVSNGVTVDPGGSANTKGTWHPIGTITRPMDFAVVGMLNRANGALTSQNGILDLAAGPQRDIVLQNFQYRGNASSDGYEPMQFDLLMSLPAGTEISARAASSTTDATDRLFDLVIVSFSL